MKDKILYLILGILIGAVITAGAFLVFSKTNKPQMPENFEGGPMMERENRGEGKDFDSTNTIETKEETPKSEIDTVENNI